MSQRSADPGKVAQFATRVLQDWGGAHIIALAYIGDRLGIFRALADGVPMTSQDLADRTGLNERYIREWAAAMAASEYIDYNPRDHTFRLSPEQVAVLADDDSPRFMGGGFLYAQACVRQLPRLMEAFKNGGGIAFAEFGPEIVEAIQRLFAPGYESAVATQWLPALGEVFERVKAGADVAEVGCGAGQALIPFAKAYLNSRFVGYDIDEESIRRARRHAANADLGERVSFEFTAAEDIPHKGHFDLIIAFNCIHDMANPRGALAGVCRALKPDGAFLWSEANASDRLEDNINPMGRLLYATSVMHCMTVSLAHGGEGLGNVVGEGTARELAREAGFSHFEKLPVEHPYHQLFLLEK
ncbi:MAG: class I SAM-dependent methyltransferase [Dehalococcoidia bacterium]